MIDLHSKADTRLVLGVIAIGVALMETISGEALQRYGKQQLAMKSPKTFGKRSLCITSSVLRRSDTIFTRDSRQIEGSY
jgi:hypothetical protein